MPRWDNDNTLFRMNGSFRASGSRLVTLQRPITKSEIVLKGVELCVVDDSSDALWRLWIKQKWEPNPIWDVFCELYLVYLLFQKNHSQKASFLGDFANVITMGGSMEGKDRGPTEADFLAYCAEKVRHSMSSIPIPESMLPKEANPALIQHEAPPGTDFLSRNSKEGVADRVRYQIQHHAVFTTPEYMGMGHYTIMPGDVICLLFGGKTPFVLRPVEGNYAFVGECYVCGLLKGEGLSGIEIGEKQESWFVLR